jgi:VWFA-related protein
MRPVAAHLVLLAGSFLLPCDGAQPGEVRIRYAPYQPPADIAVATDLVELAATVRDTSGAAIDGLERSDFALFDNLKPQTISFFSVERAAGTAGAAPARPRYVALFLDDVHAGPSGWERSRTAARRLVNEGLPPGERLGIFTASGVGTIDFSDDTTALLAAVASLQRHPERSITGFGACPQLTAYQAYAIARNIDPAALAAATAAVIACAPETPPEIAARQAQTAAENAWDILKHDSSQALDALLLVARHLSAAAGERTLLLVSPGFVSGGMERQVSALTDVCLRSHIVVNALDQDGLLPWRRTEQRSQTLTTLLAETSASTGGRFIRNNNDAYGALRTLASPPEVSYLLGFSPSVAPDGTYHKLQVKIEKNGDYRVSARPGYLSLARSEQTETAQQRIDRIAASGETMRDVPAAIRLSAAPNSAGRFSLQVVTTIDAARLPFRQEAQASLQQLTFVTILQDAAGAFLAGKQSVMDLALSRATRADLTAKGLRTAETFVVPPGSYRIRQVVRELVENHLAASTTPIEIR